MASPTVRDIIDRASTAYDSLLAVAEDVGDEWIYCRDLSNAWRARLNVVADTRRDEPAQPAAEAAVAAAAEEVARISDPHRAIDWLSTFPQVVLIALGER